MLPLHRNFKSFPFAIISSLVFISCSNHSRQDIAIINALNESIESSNKMLSMSTTDVMYSLKDKMNEPSSRERARVWYPRAEQIHQLSKDVFDYIENLKSKIKDTAVNSSQLFEKLKKYQQKILQVDAKVANQFKGSLKVFTQSIDSSDNNQERLFKEYFKNVSDEFTIAMLSKLQNHVRINEIKMVSFCYDQIGSVGDWYGVGYIVVANSIIFKPKDTIEITSGMIVFDKRPDFKVFVHKMEINKEDDGYAHYKFQVASKPGKYYVPVTISYVDLDGKPQSIQKEIKYTVANIQK